ncbi:3-dehydroquinate synthase family protein [Spirobacillus cienkowskii]|uniref:3-dehydroquinate synthase family protein n=1 Tax=Spirobacillus cienkowskii TaxID=495820 RepID=UPI0030CB098E
MIDNAFIQFFDELKNILNRFFKLGYTRFSVPKKEISDRDEAYQLACQIYKRGFISFLDKNEKKSHDEISFLNTSNFIIKLNSQKKDELFLIIDKNFLTLHEDFNDAIKNFNFIIFESQESNKTLETVFDLMQKIQPKVQTIYAIGGGIILDLVGFTCKLLNKEVVYVPTTILAAVDACIGGKTSVNYLPYGKNQIGFFSQPKEILFVPQFFETLPFHEKISGLGEALKHSWIFGTFLEDFYIFEKIYTETASLDDFKSLILKNIKYKTFITQEDPLELTSFRSILNFGHTFAHFLESICIQSKNYSIPHGIAVLYGIQFLLSANLINWPKSISNYKYLINSICKNFSIPIHKKITVHDIEFYLNQDKKNSHSHEITLILPEYGILNEKNDKSQVTNCIKRYSTNAVAFQMLEFMKSFE